MKAWIDHHTKAICRCANTLALLCLSLLTQVQAQAQTVEYIHTDALGSPIAVTDANQNVIERSEYAPYGDLLNRPDADGPSFTGHVLDAATGLNYMQQRYYDSGIGRFLSVDPVTANSGTGTNFNRYWYANNNPYKFIDPDGREVGFAKDAPADFLRNIAVAIRYLNASGSARSIGETQLRPELVTIVPAQDRTSAYQTNYNPETRVLTWADKGGVEGIDLYGGEKKTLSPALALEHEFGHAINDLFDPSGTDARTFDSQYGNQEERNVIEEVERPSAERLGELRRGDHGGVSKTFACPTPDCP